MATNNEVLRFGKIPLAATVAGFVVTAPIYAVLVQSSINSTHTERVLQLEADNVQNQVNQKIVALRNQLKGLANTLHMAQVVTDSDYSVRTTEESALLSLIPHAKRVRIFGVREAEVERDAIPPFSFTALDLVNRAEIGEIVHPEAIRDGSSWIITIATPITIPGDDKIQGTLFVYLDIAVLDEAISAPGQLTLFQAIGSSNATQIHTTGSGNSPEPDHIKLTL